jgi:hypothetical protein
MYRRRMASPEHDVTREQIERGAAALQPFVDAWNLPLNPEDLDELASAVLRHGRKTGPIDRSEWGFIEQSVREQIDAVRQDRANLYRG